MITISNTILELFQYSKHRLSILDFKYDMKLLQ